MRLMPFAAAATALTLLVASLPAEAQSERKRTHIVVKKKRNYLDAGTTVKPGGAKYHDYVLTSEFLYPRYGYDPTGASRYPLPGQFYLPGF